MERLGEVKKKKEKATHCNSKVFINIILKSSKTFIICQNVDVEINCVECGEVVAGLWREIVHLRKSRPRVCIN